MMDIERWFELKKLEEDDPEALFALGKSLGLSDCLAKWRTAIMAAENRQRDPQMARRHDEWFGGALQLG